MMIKKMFCGLSLLTLTCVLTLSGADIVRAGEINANEARLVSAASGTFTYEGKTYRASSQYVSQLRSYLCKDDVDFTAADVNSLISDMYANVGTGVKEGYLEEIGGSSDAPEADDAPEEPEEETSGETFGDDAPGWPLDEEALQEDDSKEPVSEGEDASEEKNTSKEESAPTEETEPEPPTYTVEETPKETKIVDKEGSVIFTAAPMIKAVGYHKQTVRGLLVFAGLMLTAIIGGVILVIRHEKA